MVNANVITKDYWYANGSTMGISNSFVRERRISVLLRCLILYMCLCVFSLLVDYLALSVVLSIVISVCRILLTLNGIHLVVGYLLMCRRQSIEVEVVEESSDVVKSLLEVSKNAYIVKNYMLSAVTLEECFRSKDTYGMRLSASQLGLVEDIESVKDLSVHYICYYSKNKLLTVGIDVVLDGVTHSVLTKGGV